jgi:hypothetical protein
VPLPLYKHKVGEVLVKQKSKVFSLDCVCPLEGATEDHSLILGFLDRALCNLADLERL